MANPTASLNFDLSESFELELSPSMRSAPPGELEIAELISNRQTEPSGDPTSNESNTRQPDLDITKTQKTKVEVEVEEDFRATGFAAKEELSHWFPQILFDEKKSWRIWLSKRNRALLLHTVVVGAILIANFSLTLFAASNYAQTNGVGVIYEGSCSVTKKLDTWLHLLINLLSTGMLMASNYCMQLQAAPSRENIDRAHANNEWLDIGVPSIRNLWWISNWRRASWVLLGLSSLPIHLIYNSAVFTSLASNDYTVAVVNEAFLHNGTWNLTAAESRGLADDSRTWVIDDQPPRSANDWGHWSVPALSPKGTISAMQENATNEIYQKINTSSCFEIYDDYWVALGNAVVVVKNESVQGQADDSLLLYASIIPKLNDWATNQWALLNGTWNGNWWTAVSPSDLTGSWYVGPDNYEVDYCLVQIPTATANRCRFEYSPPVLITVCILNFLKTAVMLATYSMRKFQWKIRKDSQKEVLYTLGDAVASFMRHPDPTTKDQCLATSADFRSKRTLKGRFVKEPPNLSKEPRLWKPRPHSWASAASLERWVILLSVCAIVLAVASFLLGRGITTLKHRGHSTTMRALWKLGFGSLTPFTYIYIGLPKSDPAGLISNILVANLPQLIVSLLYLSYNAMLSCFLVQLEFSKMCTLRKPLRVSEPEGIQRSSYFISLPLKYGVPLYTTSGIIHWLISQSFFLARITAFLPDGSVDQDNSFSTCGYSPIALFITILTGIILVFCLCLLGFFKYDGTMPLVSTNSRAISAACHVLKEDRADGYLLPVQWAVVERAGGVGHCAFTTAYNIETPDENHRFA